MLSLCFVISWVSYTTVKHMSSQRQHCLLLINQQHLLLLMSGWVLCWKVKGVTADFTLNAAFYFTHVR